MAPRIGSLLYRVAGRQAKENAAAVRAAKENAERSEALQTLRTIKAMTANQLTPNTNQKLLNTLQFIRRGPNRKLHRNAVEHVKFLKKARARGRWRAAVAVEKLKKGTVMSHITNPLFDTSNNNNEAAEQAKTITASAIASIIKKNKKNENRRAQERKEFTRKKYEKMIKTGEVISESDRKKIELLYNNLAKELNKRNAANKAAANKEAAEKAKTNTASAIASAIKKNKNIAKRMELEKVLTRLEKLNAPSAIKLYNTISNNNKRILNNNENLSNRYKSFKQQINNAKSGAKMGAFVQELSTQPPLKQKRPSIFNRGKAFLAARAASKPPPPSFNEAAARNALKRYLNAAVKPKYNKALVNAILRLPKENLNNNTRRRLKSPRMYAFQRGAGALGRGAVTAGGALGRGAGALGRGAVTAGGALGRGAVTAGGALGRGLGGLFSRSAAVPVNRGRGAGAFGRGLGGFFSRGAAAPVNNGRGPAAAPVNNGRGPAAAPVNNGRGPAAPVNSEPKPASTTTGVSVGVGPGPGNHYENEYRYRRGGGGGGGIVFKPQITVGAARIGAQTFGGTRVGGQQMGGSRVRTGNTGSTTLKTGNTGGTQVSNVGKVSNAGRLAVSAPTSSGNRQLAATSEQLIRGAGGAEAVEQGIKALKAANGNVTRAKAASRLPNSTFTNIYAMGGPNAAKRLVETRRRRRTVGRVGGRRGRGLRVASKKRVTPKPRKQYIKLTPYQFRRLTDHIKKNNLRKVLIKEITH